MNETYKRQIPLIGEEGQNKLFNANVLIIGAGGIGNIAAKFLASSGVGQITIFDKDKVEKSNLNRQILFNTGYIGKSKAKSLEKTLLKISPELSCCGYEQEYKKINNGELWEYHVILDCTDNLETSYILELGALACSVPLVFAKTSKYFGVVTVIRDKPYLRKNYPTKQLNKDNSVFPPIGGVIGSLQAGFAIKLILGLNVDNDVVHYDFLNNVMTKFSKKGETENET